MATKALPARDAVPDFFDAEQEIISASAYHVTAMEVLMAVIRKQETAEAAETTQSDHGVIPVFGDITLLPGMEPLQFSASSVRVLRHIVEEMYPLLNVKLTLREMWNVFSVRLDILGDFVKNVLKASRKMLTSVNRLVADAIHAEALEFPPRQLSATASVMSPGRCAVNVMKTVSTCQSQFQMVACRVTVWESPSHVPVPLGTAPRFVFLFKPKSTVLS